MHNKSFQHMFRNLEDIMELHIFLDYLNCNLQCIRHSLLSHYSFGKMEGKISKCPQKNIARLGKFLLDGRLICIHHQLFDIYQKIPLNKSRFFRLKCNYSFRHIECIQHKMCIANNLLGKESKCYIVYPNRFLVCILYIYLFRMRRHNLPCTLNIGFP